MQWQEQWQSQEATRKWFAQQSESYFDTAAFVGTRISKGTEPWKEQRNNTLLSRRETAASKLDSWHDHNSSEKCH